MTDTKEVKNTIAEEAIATERKKIEIKFKIDALIKEMTETKTRIEELKKKYAVQRTI